MNGWRLRWDGYRPDEEGLRESLSTLGNGGFATRGATTDSAADLVHYPGTYLAGGYDRAVTRIGDREVENEDLVNFPNWLPLTFRLDGGAWFRLDDAEVLTYRHEVRLREGVLAREARVRLKGGRTVRWSERRIVSMDDPHLGAISVDVTPEGEAGKIEILSALDGTVVNGGVARYRDLEGRHLEVLDAAAVDGGLLFLRCRTRRSRLEVAEAARTRLYAGSDVLDAKRTVEERSGWIGERLETTVAADRPLRIEKVVALHASRDHAIAEPGTASCETARRAPRFDALLAAHERAWRGLWERFDLTLDLADECDDGGTQLKLRTHTFHLLQTVSPHSIDLDVGVPARGWHGEAYRGHIFWDELFIFPLLSLRMPVLTRALLLYRFRRLPAARRAAVAAGHRGAMFPWQSGSDGREESQTVHLNPDSGRWIADVTHRQRHIGAAVAYNVWHYYEVTEDHDFLDRYGAELMLEIARFWASLATYDEARDRYEILGIMGPDEYHTGYPDADPEDPGGLDNNAYTNVMAAWTLTRARDALDLLDRDRQRRLRDDLGLTSNELDRWVDVSRKLEICFHGDGIISQFRGYDELEEFDWEGYRERYGDIQRLDRILEAEGDSTNRYKVSKQADVLMLFYLLSADELGLVLEQLGHRIDAETIPRNVEYYLARTSHGSTLSAVTHAWVLARSDRRASWHLFRRSLDSDFADVQGGTTPEGIHTGAMAGTIDLVHRCYTGLETRGGVLRFDPVLPRSMRRLRMKMAYRRQRLEIEVTHDRLTIASRPVTALPITLAYRGHYRRISPGETHEFRLLEKRPLG